MKFSHLCIASSVCLVAAIGGCGGSGTPLPVQKVAVVTFTARTTAAITPTTNKRINDYAINGFNIPAGLSAPVYGTLNKEKLILDNYLLSLKLSANAFGSYSAGTPSKSYLSIVPLTNSTSNNLEFGKLADLSLIMGNQNLTKGDITALLVAANPSMTANAMVCPQSAACDLSTPPIPVFYNISVSIQTR